MHNSSRSRRHVTKLFCFGLLHLSVALSIANAAEPVEFLIVQATIHDGAGGEPRVGNVAIDNGRIVGFGGADQYQAKRTISAKGLVLAPGFIDLHSHSDRSLVKQPTNHNTNYLYQGTTLVVTGNCGSGPVDVGKYFQQLEKVGVGTNVMHLIPQGSVRRSVLGIQERKPDKQELAKMKSLVQKGMSDGACGISTGLIYVPSSYASTGELVELAKTVAAAKGIYATHMRGEGTGLLRSVEEALSIGKQGGCPVHISHFKASGQAAWGLAGEAIRAIATARAEGRKVTADQYPYTASSTSLGAMVVPKLYRDRKAFQKAIADPATAGKLKESIASSIKRRGNGARLFVASYRKNPAWQGMNIAEIAKKEKIDAVELVVKIQLNGGASMVNFGMQEEEVRLIMKQSFVATASDGSSRQRDDTKPHPRSYGCFPRKIGRFALRDKVITLQHAIRASSGLPADILKLKDRGYVRMGYHADLVLFDPATFIDTATFKEPHQYATGVTHLFVNGKLAIDDRKLTKVLAGKVIRHSSK